MDFAESVGAPDRTALVRRAAIAAADLAKECLTIDREIADRAVGEEIQVERIWVSWDGSGE